MIALSSEDDMNVLYSLVQPNVRRVPVQKVMRSKYQL